MAVMDAENRESHFVRTLVLGIDPGLSGALCFMGGSDDYLSVLDMPVHELVRNRKTKRELDRVELSRLIRSAGPITHAFVEQVGSMPGQGVSSVFSFGKTYGAILGILAALDVPVTDVTPQRWKKALQVPAAKDGARARASQLMPRHAGNWTRVKDDGRAESALIALYGITNQEVKK